MKKTNTLLCLKNIQPIFFSIALKRTKAGSRSSSFHYIRKIKTDVNFYNRIGRKL